MTETVIKWPNGSLIDKLLCHVFGRMRFADVSKTEGNESLSLEDFLSLSSSSQSVLTVNLPAHVAYADRFDARTASSADQKKALVFEKEKFLPIETGAHILIASPLAGDDHQITVLCVRHETLSEITEKANALGLEKLFLISEQNNQAKIALPDLAERQQRSRKLTILSMATLCFGAWGLLSALEFQSAKALHSVSSVERDYRAAVLERVESTRELSVFGAFASLDPIARSPQGRLQTLSEITTSSDDQTWWNLISLSEDTIKLTGQSRDAAAARQSIAEAFSTQTVRFDQTVTDMNDELQAFTLVVFSDEAAP